MNDLFGMDLIPDPKNMAAKDRCGDQVSTIYPYLLQELRPTLCELGIETIEELGYDKPELAMKHYLDMEKSCAHLRRDGVAGDPRRPPEPARRVQPFTCDIPGCGAKLYSQLALRQHRSRHKSASKFYDCGVCGKRIKSAAYWLIHRKSHTEEPRFSCDICGKKFHRKYKLKQHSTVHSGIAEFQCEICGKYFTIKHNLTAHYKLHARKDQKAMTNRNFNEK
ncbi:cytochrome c oxidase polypeptide [Culex quinquefasciatus]|uniref:Cytochrome c oxidase subunit 5A, mitochondrial n=1 Tax=Culex quinquefasciatus TaxID=7176 RepID=B0X5N8_CULQU|nr:cytochrome c oxidase polypeptide [Culex quinquefasciatus]|eukprot:XP_001864960.1 cytochrome c oxidase polypeptide [Culex quinquefasciatus]